MPAWNLPDRQIWQLVALYPPPAECRGDDARGRDRADRRIAVRRITAHYVGSAACKSCHAEIYERWSKTRMANVVRDPREHPDAIIPGPLKARSVFHLHQGRHRLRLRQPVEAALLQEGRRRLFPASGPMGCHAQIWRQYFVPNSGDWWAPLYPPDNFQRPTGPLCDGCHSVNYDIKTKTRHRMECRLREMPRAGRGACEEAAARQHS